MAQATPSTPTACLALADGTIFYGQGFGATGQTVAELCFNTAMTGYQEIMTDPSYAGQIVTFTFPHVGNVGVNPEDDETADPVAEGMVVKWDPTAPSNWRSAEALKGWLERRGRIAIGGSGLAVWHPGRGVFGPLVDETVVFAWIVYESRAKRDEINEKVMKDPRLNEMMEGKDMPFDAKRMFWGGFETIVEL